MKTSPGFIATPKFVRASLAAVLAGAVVSLAGCGKDDPASPNPDPTPTSTTYTGATAGSTAGASGSLTVTIATGTPAPGLGAQAVVVATVVFTPSGGGAQVTRTGTWNTDTDALEVDSDEWLFNAGFEGSNLDGYFSGPGGVSGAFSLFPGGAEVVVIVGTWGSPAPRTSGGCSPNWIFNFAIQGAVVRGHAYNICAVNTIPVEGAYDALTGDVIIYRGGTTSQLAEGNYNPEDTPDASGTWDDGTYTGTWTGNQQ